MRASLSQRYGVAFDSVGFNLYRDGRDSVTWHGDRIDPAITEPVVALVSLGDARRFLLRPRGGGKSVRLALGHGDLLVTGGRTQRKWEHSVPKVARAGPRISLAFRHGLDPRGYGRVETRGGRVPPHCPSTASTPWLSANSPSFASRRLRLGCAEGPSGFGRRLTDCSRWNRTVQTV